MVTTGPIPYRWSRPSGGAPVHGRRPDRGTGNRARREPSSRRPDSRLARSGGRVAIAAVFIAATLLSPGVRDACAACCRDEAPAVAAPLAAGIAPVHACCAPAAPSCCGAAHAAEAPDDAESPTASAACQASARADCRCRLSSREDVPASPTRRGLEDRPGDHAPAAIPAAAAALPAAIGRPAAWSVVIKVDPGRPARILYGVWRN